MKPSPLQLKWVAYPQASYEANTDADGSSDLQVEIHSEIEWEMSGNHMAMVRVSTSDDVESQLYRVDVIAVAQFNFDLEIAAKEYRPRSRAALPGFIAVNVARILYSSAREYIAMMTSRAPYGSAVLRSVLIEPNDVRLSSDVEPEVVLRELFGAGEEEISDLRDKVGGKLGQDNRRA